MKKLGLAVVLGVVWLSAGAIAAFQNDYFVDGNCPTAMETASMVASGPLTYLPGFEYFPGMCVQHT